MDWVLMVFNPGVHESYNINIEIVLTINFKSIFVTPLHL